MDNPEFLVYHWSGHSAGFSPATGELALSDQERINLGEKFGNDLDGVDAIYVRVAENISQIICAVPPKLFYL